MEITRTSMVTGIQRTLNLDVTPEQLASYQAGGLLLQDAFPNLSAADREFIKTGVTNDEWQQLFGDGGEGDDDDDDEGAQ